MYQCLFEGKKVLVKFTRNYGEEVHRFMYDKGFAPELLNVEKLQGGWLAVVMKYIDGVRVPTEDVENCKQFLESLVLPALSKMKYVHGDLRLPNIIKLDKKYIVLDYDWAGTEGSTRFPLDLNTKLPWPESVEPGGCITVTSDHDTVENIVDLQ